MESNQIKLIPVTILSMGKTFYFKELEGTSLEKDDLVICETSRGIELGKVFGKGISKEVKEGDEYPSITKRGDQNDYLIYENNLQKAKECVKITQEKADALNLGMKVVSAEYMLDLSKVII